MTHKKNEKLDMLLAEYEQHFNKPFPLTAFLNKGESNVIKEIERCIELNVPCAKTDTYFID